VLTSCRPKNTQKITKKKTADKVIRKKKTMNHLHRTLARKSQAWKK